MEIFVHLTMGLSYETFKILNGKINNFYDLKTEVGLHETHQYNIWFQIKTNILLKYDFNNEIRIKAFSNFIWILLYFSRKTGKCFVGKIGIF